MSFDKNMINILSILSNINNGIKAVLLRVPLCKNNKRYVEKNIDPNYIYHIHEAIFYQQDNITRKIEYLGMDEESNYDESPAYITKNPVNLNNLDNGYYIITIPQEYFAELMS